MEFDDFCARLAELRLDRSGGVAKPYKPLMVAAVVLLIHKGKIPTRSVYLDGGLRSAFRQLLEQLYPGWPRPVKPEYPFRHLESDGVWTLVPHDGASDDLLAARAARDPAWTVLRHVRCAQIDAEVFERLATSRDARLRVLQSIAVRYLPVATSGKLWHLLGDPWAPTDPTAGKVSDVLTERALEERLESDWADTPFARLGVELSSPSTTGRPGRQVLTPVNSIDLLGFRPSHREWWVIELKRGRPSDAVVGQVSRYLGWMNEECGRSGDRAVGAIVARDADRKLRLAVAANPALSLWRYDAELRILPMT